MLGVIAMTIAAAYASLLFQGAASAYTGLGFCILMLGTAVGAMVVAVKSRQPGLITGPDEAATIALASVIAGIAGLRSSASTSPEAAALMVIILMGSAGLLAGVLFWLVGRFHLGQLIRYLPYPVISGFLAGSGLLLLWAGLGLAGGIDHLGLSHPATFLQLLPRWQFCLPALLLAIALVRGGRYISHSLLMPMTLLAAVVLFFSVVWLSGADVGGLRQAGWLYQPPVQDDSFDYARFAAAWATLKPDFFLSALPQLLLVALVALLAMLLQTSALEQVLGHDLELDAELRAQSTANLLGGCCGALPMVPFISDTLLNLDIAGPNRLAGMVMALLCVLGAIAGLSIMPWIPQFVLAAILIYFGVGLLSDTLIKEYGRARRADYAVMLLVALTVNLFGFMQGALLGVLFTAGFFLRDYSRLQPVRQQYHAGNAPGRVSRPVTQHVALEVDPHWLAVYVLEGYLFFGSAHRLYQQVKAAFNHTYPECLILDMGRVQGIDATGIAMLDKLAQRQAERQGVLVLCDMRAGLPLPQGVGIVYQPDLNHALEYAEDLRLVRLGLADDEAQPLPGLLDELAAYLKPRSYQAGELLIRQGDTAQGLLFITAGSVSVRLMQASGKTIRLRRFMCGTVLGEVSLYAGTATSASVYADEATRVLQLSPAALSQLEFRAPALALQLHRQIAAVMANRLQDTNLSLLQAAA
nr:SulP family inorganic anion transporter [Craterilacuibacter sp. RT1T]